MYEAMQYVTIQHRNYTLKLRKGFFKTLEAAKAHAVMKAEGIPFVQLNGRCVWSPMHDRLGRA